MAKFIIRDGRSEDCHEIQRLIKEHAVYEKIPNSAKLTPEDLLKNGFETQPPRFNIYVVENPDKPGILLGHAMYYWAYSSWTGKKFYLRDFYIAEPLRGKGVGKAMFRKLIETAVKTNCREMQWIVVNWNPARNFYFKLGASDITESEGWRLFCINRPEMDKLLLEK